ncbi:ATP-binding protein [Tardiphaga sp.]|uniref:ATP-binding protein n=1 Tax=Tardiphaga sp. TaxID=1926292 RepID=UPI00261602C8|nr:ATP-binding protein [Tardiphaga sp.]MDB5619133.1 signal transduction histidine kinase, glucose-6-phosphate specific [Tardiphaga sp.]
MWQRLSLRARLNLLLALVLMLGLVINIARLALEAGPRVAAEDRSVVLLAREFIATLVAGLNEAPDPEARLQRIVADLAALRHVSIVREEGTAPVTPAARRDDDEVNAPPAWFVRLIHPEQTTLRVPVVVNGRSLGALVIASHPNDEMAEIWDGIVTQLEVGAAIAAIMLLITMTVVSRALAPIGQLSDAMARIEGGHYQTRVAPAGPPELAAIGERLNTLATALGAAVEDKRRLAERVVSLQDVERKEIARELHDEFGPFLFALRAHGSALQRIAGSATPDIAALQNHGSAMPAQVNELQQLNRRVLERLRPAGLSELGLREALSALTRLWREAHPGVAVAIAMAPGPMSETVELTIYRVVQEALTNVFRHAGATRVEVTIAPTGVDEVSVRVQDDGAGLAADHRLGLGLTGMRERVLALGGTMDVTSTERGVTVEARVPTGVGTSPA